MFRLVRRTTTTLNHTDCMSVYRQTARGPLSLSLSADDEGDPRGSIRSPRSRSNSVLVQSPDVCVTVRPWRNTIRLPVELSILLSLCPPSLLLLLHPRASADPMDPTAILLLLPTVATLRSFIKYPYYGNPVSATTQRSRQRDYLPG